MISLSKRAGVTSVSLWGRVGLRVPALLAALGLLLAACGGAGASGSPAAGKPASAAVAATKPSASAPASVAAAKTAASPAPRKVKASYATLVATNMAPYIAQQAGIFASHGLDVDISFTKDGPTTMTALVSGDVQFAELSDPSLTNAVLQGAAVEWVAVPVHTPELALMSQPGIASVEDLKGKTIGVTSAGSLTALFVEYTLRQHGLNPQTDVKIVAVGGGPQGLAAIVSNQIDAGIYGPPDDIRAANAGKKILVNYRGGSIGVPQGAVAVRKDFAAANHDLVQAYVSSFEEAIKRYKSDPALAKSIIGQVLKLTDPKVVDDTYAGVLPVLDSDIVPRAKDQQTMLDMLAPSNPKAKDAKPQDFYDDSFAKTAVAAAGGGASAKP
jgi:ABC-type nitrate/sulfonate/bicarbonate transport system substrate-binding protein